MNTEYFRRIVGNVDRHKESQKDNEQLRKTQVIREEKMDHFDGNKESKKDNEQFG